MEPLRSSINWRAIWPLECGYLGNHQSHQLYQPNENTGSLIFTANSAINGTNTSLYPDIGGISGTASFGFGNYDAMTVKLTKRLSNGLTFQSAYTWGHALADTGTTLSGAVGFYTVDNANQNSSYSTAAWDIRQNCVASFDYAIPFGRGKQYGSSLNRAVDIALGNWQVNGILSLRTGQPDSLDSQRLFGGQRRMRTGNSPGKNPTQPHPVAGTPASGSMSPTSAVRLRAAAFHVRLPIKVSPKATLACKPTLDLRPGLSTFRSSRISPSQSDLNLSFELRGPTWPTRRNSPLPATAPAVGISVRSRALKLEANDTFSSS